MFNGPVRDCCSVNDSHLTTILHDYNTGLTLLGLSWTIQTARMLFYIALFGRIKEMTLRGLFKGALGLFRSAVS